VVRARYYQPNRPIPQWAHLGHECVELPCLSQLNTSPPNIVLPFLNSHTTPYIRLHMASLLVQLPLTGFLIHYWPTRSSLACSTALGSSDTVSLPSSTSPLRQHWTSMAQSKFTDLLKLHWLPQHLLAAWTIQAFTGPLWQYLPSLAFPDNTGLCWPIHNFDPLRGLRLSLAHSHLDNVDLCWPTPTPLIHSDNTGLHWPTRAPLVHQPLLATWAPLVHSKCPGLHWPTRTLLVHSHLDSVDLCWPTLTPLIHSDHTGCH